MQDIKVLKVDQTEYWCDEIKKKVKRIFTVYLFNPNKRVHCCEITPSYECVFLEYQIDFPDDISEEERDRIYMEVTEVQEDVAYYHCSGIDNLPEFKLGFFPEGMMGVCSAGEFEAEDCEWIDAASEWARCNCV
jgi:hypothetical protein